MKKVAEFSINYLQYLNESGKLNGDLPDFIKGTDFLIECYRDMVLTRVFDAKAVALQRTGKLGTFPASLAQEAVFVGLGKAMQKDDVFAPYYRDQGAFFQRGVRPQDIFAYWGGDERGSHYPPNGQDFPICVPIATQALHGAGAAYAIKLKGEKRAVVTTIGEGGTSEGSYYEALNFAGMHQLPMVFVVNNNQWAISVPRKIQTNVQTIAQKAIAAGIPGIQVDGNDIISVYGQVTEALNNARAGKGPMLIEAITYRLCDHTTADDAKRYVPKEDLDKAWEVEPVKRLKTYLIAEKVLTEEMAEKIEEDCKKQIENEVSAFQNMPKDKPTAMFDYLYEKLPAAYDEQYHELN